MNVKGVRTSEDIEAFGAFRLAPDARRLGPRLGPEMKRVLAAARAGGWSLADDGSVELAGHRLERDEYALTLDPGEALEGLAVRATPANDAVVALEVRTSPSSSARASRATSCGRCSSARKDAGLEVSDRVRVFVEAPAEVLDAMRAWSGYVEAQVLAVELSEGRGPDSAHRFEAPLAGGTLSVALERAS